MPGLAFEEALKNASPNKRKAEERIKIGCFVGEPVQDWRKGEGIKKPRMWAQYGGNHAGMAFVFDKDLLVEECKKTVAGNWAVYDHSVGYDHDSEPSSSTPTTHLTLEEASNETLIAKKVLEKAESIMYDKERNWQDEGE